MKHCPFITVMMFAQKIMILCKMCRTDLNWLKTAFKRGYIMVWVFFFLPFLHCLHCRRRISFNDCFAATVVHRGARHSNTQPVCLINSVWVWFDQIRLTVARQTRANKPSAVITLWFKCHKFPIGAWHHLFMTEGRPLQTSERSPDTNVKYGNPSCQTTETSPSLKEKKNTSLILRSWSWENRFSGPLQPC